MRNDSIERFTHLINQPKYQNTAQSLYQRSRIDKYNSLLGGMGRSASKDSREAVDSFD